MCMQDISPEDKETNTKVYIIIISISSNHDFLCPTVMVAILVNNLIVTLLIHPAKLLLQYMLRSLMKDQGIPLMLVLEWPQADTPTTSPLIPVMIL